MVVSCSSAWAPTRGWIPVAGTNALSLSCQGECWRERLCSPPRPCERVRHCTQPLGGSVLAHSSMEADPGDPVQEFAYVTPQARAHGVCCQSRGSSRTSRCGQASGAGVTLASLLRPAESFYSPYSLSSWLFCVGCSPCPDHRAHRFLGPSSFPHGCYRKLLSLTRAPSPVHFGCR